MSSSAQETPASGRFSRMGRALRHRNYRLFFAGQSISFIGSWLTHVASSWIIYRITGSGLLLGAAAFASQAPSFFLSPFVGVWVDRVNRHRTLMVTQSLAMVQSGLLAYFALTGTLDVGHIIALNLFQGLISAVDIPTRQAFVVEMIEDRADLGNALALNSSMVNSARLIGPTVAAALIGLVGEAYCFLIDSLSYVAVLGSLLAMRVTHVPRTPSGKRVLQELREGMSYVVNFPPIRAVLILLTSFAIAGMPYQTLLPVIAREQLHGEAGTLGLLTGAAGAGALFGALQLAGRPTVLGLGRVINHAGLVFGLGLMALSQSRWLALSLPLMVLVGAGMMMQVAACNTIVQTLVDEDKRGRVMALYSTAVFGVMPFGGLLAGRMSDSFGAGTTLLLGGSICCIASLLFRNTLPRLRDHIRPIYVRLGILPEIERSVNEAVHASDPPPA
jgi:MFS family permease